MHSSPRAGAVTKPGGQRRVSMKISDAPVASKAGKTQRKAVFFANYFLFFCGGFEYERIVTVIRFLYNEVLKHLWIVLKLYYL